MKITFKEFVNLLEGVDDPGIFKAIFLAGGPGSGKSFIARKTVPNAAFGLRLVNSDQALEFLLKKSGIPQNMLTMTPAQLADFAKTRDRAKQIIQKKEDLFVKGRLGLLIDGTGRDFKKITQKKSELEIIGYDTFMIFVNTSLDVALERNRKRKRKVDEKLVKRFWQDVQNNIGKFQSEFGAKNFLIVDNNDVSDDILSDVFKSVMKFVNKPIRSNIAKQWIEAQRNPNSPAAKKLDAVINE